MDLPRKVTGNQTSSPYVIFCKIQDICMHMAFANLETFHSAVLNYFCFTDKPGKPVIRNTETEVSGCNITLHWTTPSSNGCSILFYTVRYRKKTSADNETRWMIRKVTKENSSQLRLILNCTSTYEFEVYAWNAKGSSRAPFKAWPIRTGGQIAVRYDSVPNLLSTPGKKLHKINAF